MASNEETEGYVDYESDDSTVCFTEEVVKKITRRTTGALGCKIELFQSIL